MKARLGKRLLETLKPGSYEVWDKDLPGFVLRVRGGGTQTYYCVYRTPSDRRTRISIGTTAVLTPVQARDRAKGILADIIKGIDPMAMKRQSKTYSFETYITEHYAPWVEANRKSGPYMVARLKRCFFKNFKDLSLTEITAWSIEQWRSKRLKAGIEPSTVNRDLSIIKAAYSKAIEWEILTVNPLTKVKPSKVDQKGVVRFLSQEEEERFRQALDTREEQIQSERDRGNQWRRERGYPEMVSLRPLPFVDHIKPMILLSINTGMRRGEIFTLRWKDIDLTNQTLAIHGSHTKSGSTRHIPLNREALASLELWKSMSTTIELDHLVFPGKAGAVLTDTKHS